MNYKFTIFVGNLSFQMKDEEMYNYFSECGKIEYVRLIRDPYTFVGKGL